MMIRNIYKTPNHFFITCLFLFCAPVGMAQEIYFGASGGYGLGIIKNTLSSALSAQPDIVASVPVSSGTYSLGRGLQPGCFIGYNMRSKIGLEINAHFLLGKEYSASQNDYAGQTEYTGYGQMLRLTPCLRFGFGQKKLSGYMKTGLIVGILSRYWTTKENTYNSPYFGKTSTYTEWEYSGGTSLGFYSAMGMGYKVSKSWSLFLQLDAFFQSWAMKKGEMLTYQLDNIEFIQYLNTVDKESIYSRHYSTGTVNPNEPTVLPKTRVTFNSLGLSVGIQYTFKKTDRSPKTTPQ